MTVRLSILPLLLEAAAERVVSVVVGRGELEHRPELPLRLVVAVDAEVRDPEGLADRRLVRLALLRLLQRDRRLGRHTLRQVLASLLKQVICLAHLRLISGTESSPPPSQAGPSSLVFARSRYPEPVDRNRSRAAGPRPVRTAAPATARGVAQARVR